MKRIVCLANSRKPNGRCIAGIEISGDRREGWIRPISSRRGEEVSEDEQRYEDGGDPALLDVMDVPLLRYHPHACQTENWLLDPSQYWRRIGHLGWRELQNFVENPPTLWVNGHSTYHGEHDEIPLSEADALPRSLVLIRVPSVNLSVFAPFEAFGNPTRRVQAAFQHGSVSYALRVTDPQVESEFLARSDGKYSIGECCLTISLGEPYRKKGEEYRYKLVAGIIRAGVGAGA